MHEAILNRVSTRSFQNRPLTEEDLEALRQILTSAEEAESPFGTRTTLHLQPVMKDFTATGERFGTYGVIDRAQGYLVPVVPAVDRAHLIDLGYRLELVVLALTNRGIGTCWLGGTFRRTPVHSALGISEDLTIPAIIPYGYPKERRRLIDHAIRFVAKSQQRLPFDTLFSLEVAGTPLPSDHSLRDALEMVRLAPSASNKQPWRLIVEGDRVHFFLHPDKKYKDLRGVNIQMIDMGIAMAHFELSLVNGDRPFKVQVEERRLLTEGEYICTYHLYE